MSDFKQRLIKEIDELKEKIDKLEDFLQSDKPSGIDNIQIELLNIQLAAMKTYLYCLTSRLKNLKPNN